MVELPPAELLTATLPPKPILTRRRGIANERIEERFFRIELSQQLDATIVADGTLFWHKIAALDKITLTGPHRKWLPGLIKAT